MNFNSNNNINNQFGCLPLHSIRLRSRINRLNSKNKQQHTTACTKPRQMQQVRVPGLDLTIDIHPVLQAPSRKLQLWAQSLTEPWAESWRDPPPPGPGPPHPAPALTPGLAQISGDPAWLTQGTLPPPPPPYLTLSRHWRHSTVQNTARFFGIKTKLQGHSQ